MLNKIKFSYKETEEKGFTPHHVVYKCKIKYCGLQYTFKYQCNPNYNSVTKEDAVYSLLSDMMAYDNARDINDFKNDFGYEDYIFCVKAYKGCKKTSNALHRLFTEGELETLITETEAM